MFPFREVREMKILLVFLGPDTQETAQYFLCGKMSRSKRGPRKPQNRKGKQKSASFLKQNAMYFIASALVLAALAYLIAAKVVHFGDAPDSPEEDASIEYVVSFPSDKSVNEKIDLETLFSAFGKRLVTEKDKEYFRNTYVIIQARKKGDLVANVCIIPTYYKSSKPEEQAVRVPVFEAYYIYVSPKFRGRRESIRHLFRSAKYLQSVYNLQDTQTFLVLHVSPKDEDMEVAYALYRTSGFARGAYVSFGPSEYRENVSGLLEMKSIEEAVKDYDQISEKGKKYLAMICTLRDFYDTYRIQPYTKREYKQQLRAAAKMREVLEMHHTYATV